MPVGAWGLEFGCTTISDPNRTAQYVANAQDPAFCVNGINTLAPIPFSWQYLKVDCQCDALQYETPGGPGTPPVLIPPYTTPALDPAPWYSATVPESAFFYGWTLEKVEDLQMAPVHRNVTNRATSFGGATLGALRRQGRVIKYTMLGFSNGECSMDYGFRWLADILAYSCDGGCDLCDATVRTCCPTLSNPPTYAEWDTGRWTLKNVGLVDGPHVEDPPTQSNACDIRRVSFTLASESSFAYKCPIPCLIDQVWTPAVPPCPPDVWICGPDPEICCFAVTQFNTGDDGVIVEVTAREDLNNLTITVTQDNFGYVCGVNPAPPGFVPPAPCATIVIPLLPNGSMLHYDTSLEVITVTQPGSIVVDGTPYIDGTQGVAPTFPTLRCGSFCVCISSGRCSFNALTSTASIWTVHREITP